LYGFVAIRPESALTKNWIVSIYEYEETGRGVPVKAGIVRGIFNP
jgi:hypothetical protein